MTGGADHVPHWDPRVNSRMFWMEGDGEHSRDGGSGGGDGGNTGGGGRDGIRFFEKPDLPGIFRVK